MAENQTVTLDDVRREIAADADRRERAAAEVRRERRREQRCAEEKFRDVLVVHVGAGLAAFFACWIACGLFLVAVTGGQPGQGARVVMDFAPFGLWLAGAAFYARRAFGPKRDDDGDAS